MSHSLYSITLHLASFTAYKYFLYSVKSSSILEFAGVEVKPVFSYLWNVPRITFYNTSMKQLWRCFTHEILILIFPEHIFTYFFKKTKTIIIK